MQRNHGKSMEMTRNRQRWPVIIVGIVAAAVMAGCGGYSGVDQPSGEPGESPRDAQDAGKVVVEAAEEFIGTPYRSGGTTTNGVDCSGLAFAVYRRVGVKLPRTSEAMARVGN